MKRKIWVFLTAAVFLACAAPAFAAVDSYVIKAKRIYTVSHGVIENGLVLVEKGKIAKVGKDIAVPAGLPVINAQVVVPGLIDIHTHVGVYSIPNVEENSDGNEMTNPITPQVHALDSFNFEDPAIAVGRAAGVTTVISRPGSGNIIGGTSVAVKLKNALPDEMVLKKICDLKMAIEGNPIGVYGPKSQMPVTMMGLYYMARKAFLDAKEYQKSWEDYEKDKKDGKEVAPPKRDLGKDVILMALKREIPVHIHVATANETLLSIKLADEFNFRLSLGHCYWSHLVLDELRGRKDIHFNIGPPMFFNYYEDNLTFKNAPAILSKAGLKVSLQTDALGGGQQNLRELAVLCVRYGMDEPEALKAITLNAAEAVGLEDRIGSLDPGKDADMVMLDGEPFDMQTSVNSVMIDGKVEFKNEAVKRPALQMAIAQAKGQLALPTDFKAAPQYAIRGGTILTMASAPLKNGVILVKNGKIEKIGSEIAVPPGYPVLDAKEFVVMPGLVSARSYLGITSNWRRQGSIDETSKTIVPELEVRYGVEPQSPLFNFARELGITSVQVTPGDRNVVGGQGAVLKTVGMAVDKMVVKDRTVMVFGLGQSAKRASSMPSTRMGIAAVLRETLVKAQEYKEKADQYQKDKKGKEPAKDPSLEALLPVLKGEMPVMLHAERLDDILTALRIADDFKLKLILDGATDAYKIAGEIKKRDIPVIVEDLFRGAGNIEDRGFNPQSPALLAKAGVRVAFRPSEGSWNVPAVGGEGGDLLEIAAFAFKNGMPEEAALRAVTIDAARIAGMEKQVGSLEAGKDADFLILRGHPLQTMSVAELVLINGQVVFERREGAHLK